MFVCVSVWLGGGGGVVESKARDVRDELNHVFYGSKPLQPSMTVNLTAIPLLCMFFSTSYLRGYPSSEKQ